MMWSLEHEKRRSPSALNLICVKDRSCPAEKKGENRVKPSYRCSRRTDLVIRWGAIHNTKLARLEKNMRSIRAIFQITVVKEGLFESAAQNFSVPNLEVQWGFISASNSIENFNTLISTPAAYNPIPSIGTMNVTNEYVVHNDVSLSEPPFKRQRTDNSSGDIDSVDNSSNPPIRDEQYYMESEGADCVILAGNVLFKVRLYSPISTGLPHFYSALNNTLT